MHDHEATKRQLEEPQIQIQKEGLSPEARRLFDRLAQRAYQIFEAKGRTGGRELENWLEAEGQLFEKSSLRITESKEQISVFAEVPDYSPAEIEVDLEPRRITIIGKREHVSSGRAEGARLPEKSGLLLSMSLPAEIDPDRASARLRKGVLELELKKAASPPKTKAQAASAGAN